jgi:hypothetical protein
MAKIFISLSGKDKAWGNWIAWELQWAGHEPIYQHWHFQTGQNIVLRMQEALRTAERVLVIVSGNYFDHESDYTLREMTQAVYQDMAGRDGRVVPVLVARCDLKGSFLGPPGPDQPRGYRR